MGLKDCQKKSMTIGTTPHSMSAHNLVPLQTPSGALMHKHQVFG